MRVCRWSLLPKYFVLIILELIVRGDCQISLREKLQNPIKLWMIIITHSIDYPYFRPKKKTCHVSIIGEPTILVPYI